MSRSQTLVQSLAESEPRSLGVSDQIMFQEVAASRPVPGRTARVSMRGAELRFAEERRREVQEHATCNSVQGVGKALHLPASPPSHTTATSSGNKFILSEAVLDALTEEISQKLLSSANKAALESWVLKSCLHATSTSGDHSSAGVAGAGAGYADVAEAGFSGKAAALRLLGSAGASAACSSRNSPLPSATPSDASTDVTTAICSAASSDSSGEGGLGSPAQREGGKVQSSYAGPGCTSVPAAQARAKPSASTTAPSVRLALPGAPRGNRGGNIPALPQSPLGEPPAAAAKEERPRKPGQVQRSAKAQQSVGAVGVRAEQGFFAQALAGTWSLASAAAKSVADVVCETLEALQEEDWDSEEEDSHSPDWLGGWRGRREAEMGQKPAPGTGEAASKHLPSTGVALWLRAPWEAAAEQRKNQKRLVQFLDQCRDVPKANRLHSSTEPSDTSLWLRRALPEPAPLNLRSRRQQRQAGQHSAAAETSKLERLRPAPVVIPEYCDE